MRSMGASAAIADVKPAPDPVTGIQATIWSGTQNVYNLRGTIAALLFGPGNTTKVHVRYEEASGCYGHNGADDCAADAALLSKAVGEPVRLQWTRQNEHGWEPLGEAAAHEMEAGITGGKLVAWHHRLYALTANSRPGSTQRRDLAGGHSQGLLARGPADQLEQLLGPQRAGDLRVREPAHRREAGQELRDHRAHLTYGCGTADPQVPPLDGIALTGRVLELLRQRVLPRRGRSRGWTGPAPDQARRLGR